MECEKCKGGGFLSDSGVLKECPDCLGIGEKLDPSTCKDGKHIHCEDIIYNGETLVVCHDCKKTLGRKTEVYSRVVGYLRPVSGWNRGKQSEFEMRKLYKVGLDST